MQGTLGWHTGYLDGSSPLYWFDDWLLCSTVVPGSSILREMLIFSYHLSCARLTVEYMDSLSSRFTTISFCWSQRKGTSRQTSSFMIWPGITCDIKNQNLSQFSLLLVLYRMLEIFPSDSCTLTTVSLQSEKSYAILRATDYLIRPTSIIYIKPRT